NVHHSAPAPAPQRAATDTPAAGRQAARSQTYAISQNRRVADDTEAARRAQLNPKSHSSIRAIGTTTQDTHDARSPVGSDEARYPCAFESPQSTRSEPV